MSEEHGIYSGVVDIARNGVDEVIRLRALNAELVEERDELRTENRVLVRQNGRWQEKIEAIETLNAELVEALRRCRDMVGHPDNLAFIDAALAKVGESK